MGKKKLNFCCSKFCSKKGNFLADNLGWLLLSLAALAVLVIIFLLREAISKKLSTVLG
ncbi:MAG: hypothetical protein AB1668_07290 [Nanoarchaeota archaeon]